MRHRNSGKKLGRNHNQRKALLKGLARSIFLHGSIETTKARATAVSPLVDKICHWAKNDSLVNRRQIFAYFQDQTLVNAIVEKVKSVFVDHQGSFLTSVLIKRRQGDDALVVKLSLAKPFTLILEKPPVEKKEKKEEKKETKTVKKTTKKS